MAVDPDITDLNDDRPFQESEYSKSGGKNGKNEWGASTHNISESALSKVMVLQVYKRNDGHQFSAFSIKTVILGVHQFAFLPPQHILTLHLQQPKNKNKTGFELSDDDMKTFKDLEKVLKNINQTMKTFQKRNQGE